MDKREIQTDSFHLEYSVYEYKFTPSIKMEIYRKKLFNKAKEKFQELFGKDLIDLYMYGYALNFNSLDPVFCTSIEKKCFDDLMQQEVDSAKVEKFNAFSKTLVIKLHDFQVDKDFTVKSRKMGNLIQLYIKENPNYYVKLHFNLFKAMKQKFRGQDLLKIIWLIFYRYDYLGLLTGMQGTMLMKYYKTLNQNYQADVELFGSAINTTLNYYFGLFHDIERDFGCLGNFFNSNLKRGFYVMNPPFIEWLMEASFTHVTSILKMNQNVTVFIAIPVWVNRDRKLLNEKCNANYKIEYDHDLNVDILRKSDYLIFDKLWCKEDIQYFEHTKFRKINFAPTNILVVSNSLTSVDVTFLPPKGITPISAN